MEIARSTPEKRREWPHNHGKQAAYLGAAIYKPRKTLQYAGGRRHPIQPVYKVPGMRYQIKYNLLNLV
jgi:hypothetical protein